MKKKGVKQMILGAVGCMTCSVSVMGCYPLVPAYFAALYLENVSGFLLLGTMYIGMIFFMPAAAAVKYAIAILVAAGAVRLLGWANEGCPAFMAGIMTAMITVILSFAGGLLEWKSQLGVAEIFLEGIFIFGAVILLNRVLHGIMEWQPRQEKKEEQLKMGNGERLRTYAESFQGLSQIFHSMSMQKNQCTPEDLGRIQNELTGRVCAMCDSCALCWEQDATPLPSILSTIIMGIWNSGKPNEMAKEQLGIYCKKSRDMVEEAVQVFNRVNLNRAWYNRLLENRQVIAEQLDAMAYIMQDCAKEELVLDEKERHVLAELRYRAKEHGIVVEDLHLIQTQGERVRLLATVRSARGGCISVKAFLDAAERALGKRLRQGGQARSFIAKEASSLVFYEDTLFRGVQGIARVSKDGARISGDNFSFLELERGELLLGLSDGMGSGSTACKESELVLDLVERFMEAGFSVPTAIRMMNSAMVMKGENDLYSTVDLCNIDLYSGAASLYKIGAAATFVKRGGDVMCITSQNLPVGAETQVEIEETEFTVANGDFVVMLTDGVLEYLHVPKPEETMRDIIESIQTNNPGILAKRIMERVMLFTGGKAKDDMTVLAACIWEK
ncbi:MAG: SpoIIE family protein phosphatase [Roseburia sp.]